MQDLSSQVNTSKLLGPNSMLEGNTTYTDPDNTVMTSPGSRPVWQNIVPNQMDTDDPNLDIPAQKGPTTVVHPDGNIPASGPWRKAGE